MFYNYGGRGIRCLLTADEAKALWSRDNGAALRKPSLDRIDDQGDYTAKNCRFIELSENIARANRKRGSASLEEVLKAAQAGEAAEAYRGCQTTTG